MEGTSKIEPLGAISYSNYQLTALVLLRMFIGWHFLYEGLVKVFNPYWSSGPYLAEAKLPIVGAIFRWMADTPFLLSIVDFVNEWGLIIIGLALILGLFTRVFTWAGMALVMLYYLANPPFIAYKYSMPPEGSYIIVNKNLIEVAALFVLALFPTSMHVGLDKLLQKERDD